MSAETAKSKTVATSKFERQFIAPLSLEVCSERLASLAQKRTLQPTRLMIDADTIRFWVYKRPQTFFSLSLGLATNHASGILLRQADGATSVVMGAGTAKLGSLVQAVMIFLIVNIGSTIALLSLTDGQVNNNVISLVTFVLLIIAVPVTARYYDRENTAVLNIVENALDH